LAAPTAAGAPAAGGLEEAMILVLAQPGSLPTENLKKNTVFNNVNFFLSKRVA
jgi:hypothetical protein